MSQPARTLSAPPGAPPPAPRWIWLLLALLAAGAAFYRSDDNDYWFHLAAGRSITDHGLPASETWCLAARGESPWLPEWLFHVALYRVHQLGGDFGVALWRGFWAAAAMGLASILLLRVGAATWNGAALAVLAIAVARGRFQPRPEQLLVVLVLGYLAVFEYARATRAGRAVFLLPAQTLWANLHGSWWFGPAIAWGYALVEAARQGRDPEARSRARTWAMLGLLLCAASAIVPHPRTTLGDMFRVIGDLRTDPLTGSIEELGRWSWAADRGRAFTLWLVLAALSLPLGARVLWRKSPALGLAAAFSVVLGLLAVRFRALAATVALPALAVAFSPAGSERRRRILRYSGSVVAAAGLAWLLLSPEFVPGTAPQPFTIPQHAVALADSLRLEGPVLNTFHFGGYLLWVRGEAHPPLIDGRARGSAAFRSRYARADADPGALDSLLGEWDFTHAVLEPPRHAGERMAAMLRADPEWAMVFADDAGLLFVRRDHDPALAAARGYVLFTPDYTSMASLSERAVADSMLRDSLTRELERARAGSPLHARASLWLGLLALARNDPVALPLLEEVEDLAPATPGLALRLGYARLRGGDSEGARRAFQRALREPADAVAAREALQGMI